MKVIDGDAGMTPREERRCANCVHYNDVTWECTGHPEVIDGDLTLTCEPDAPPCDNWSDDTNDLTEEELL